jgi:hypothetical protein
MGDSEAMDITGASGAIPVSDEKRRNAHAKLYYEHIFFTEHDLGFDAPVRFDPDYNMAISWQRLIEGISIQEEDHILLRHELLELTLMETKRLKYDEAHIRASEQYNFAAIIKQKEAKV